MHHCLSATLRVVRVALIESVSQGRGWDERAGLVDRGHSLSRQELRVELRVTVAASTSSEKNVL